MCVCSMYEGAWKSLFWPSHRIAMGNDMTSYNFCFSISCHLTPKDPIYKIVSTTMTSPKPSSSSYEAPSKEERWQHNMGVCPTLYKYLLFMATNGTEKYSPSDVNHDIPHIKATFNNLCSQKETNHSVSFELKSKTNKEERYNGLYYGYYNQLREYYRNNGYSTLIDLPCPGLNQDGRYRCPWIFREIIQAFSVNQEVKGLSASSIRKSMGAFNVGIKSQNQIIRAVFPTKPYLE